MKSKFLVLALLGVASTAFAGADDAEYDFFGFRISAGYQIGINLKSSFKNALPTEGNTKEAAYARATGEGGRYESDDGGFIVKDDGGDNPNKTTYWRVPSSAAKVNGERTSVELVNSFHDASTFRSSDDDVAHGAHVELATTVGRDGDWGLDVFIGFAWMTGVGCYSANGTAMDDQGAYHTVADVATADLMAQGYLDWSGHPTGGTIGSGRAWQPGDGPQIDSFLPATLVPGTGGATSYHAEGDYNEYDIYGGLRLWYADEDVKWFKVTSTVGVGADYGDFEYHMSAARSDGFSVRESFRKGDWDVYGLLGLGIMVNFWDFDLSFDALWRYGQNALKVRSPYVNGEIERPDFIFRASLGYNF